MSAASWAEYRTSFKATAQKGVTLIKVSIPLGERYIVCNSMLLGCTAAV